MVIEIINEIKEKYYNEGEEYYSGYRYDNEDKEFEMEEEIHKALEKKGIKHAIEKEYGFDSPGYSNDFLAIAYIENGELGLETILLECM